MYVKTIEQEVMSYAIRYQRLSEMVKETFSNSKYANSTEINLYIDLTKMIREMEDIQFTDPMSISANILNLCAHYKSFFRKGYGVEAKIFLLYSRGKFEINRMYYKDYRFTDRIFHDSTTLIQNRDIIEMVCKYLDNIIFMETSEEIGNVALDISLIESKDNIPNILITKDRYNYIMTSFNFIIFRPKKHEGQDLSYVITQDNVIHQYQVDRKIKVVPQSLSPALLPFIMALTKVPERNIKSRMNVSTAINAITKAISLGRLNNSYINDARYAAGEIRHCTTSNIDVYEVESIYRSVDLCQVYNGYQFSEHGSKRYHGMINLKDPNGINEISRIYYQKTPVDFPSLL